MYKHTIGSPLAELGSGDYHTPQRVLDSSAPSRRWIALVSDVLRARSGLAAIGTSRSDAQGQGIRAGRRPPLFSLPTGRAMPAGRVP
jgi:hypothetical protein